MKLIRIFNRNPYERLPSEGDKGGPSGTKNSEDETRRLPISIYSKRDRGAWSALFRTTHTLPIGDCPSYQTQLDGASSNKERSGILDRMLNEYLRSSTAYTDTNCIERKAWRSAQRQLGELFVQQFGQLEPLHQKDRLIQYVQGLPTLLFAHRFDKDAQQRGLQNFHQCLQIMKDSENNNAEGAVHAFSKFLKVIPSLTKEGHNSGVKATDLHKNPAGLLAYCGVGTAVGAGIVAAFFSGGASIPITLFGTAVAVGVGAGAGAEGVAVAATHGANAVAAKFKPRKNQNQGLGMVGEELQYAHSQWGKLSPEAKSELKESFDSLIYKLCQGLGEGDRGKRMNQLLEWVAAKNLDPHDFDDRPINYENPELPKAELAQKVNQLKKNIFARQAERVKNPFLDNEDR